MTDITLTCRDCGETFVFATSEQEFFASKGYTNEPSRCPSCRTIRKEKQGSAQGGRSARGGFETRSYGAGSGPASRDRQMFPAVCGQCGKQTQVPFQPRNDRPVYCSTCFEAQRGGSVTSRRGGRSN
jgi:CxxC-x17-CxxC domain-containing protein